MGATDVFAVPIFFIVFRETIETGIVISVLLSFLRQQLGPEQDPVVYKKLRKQVWAGTLIGFGICIVIGCGLIGGFYGAGVDGWGQIELIWEGTFALLASVIISVMGAALLRVSKLQAKWRVKLAKALEAKDNKAEKASNRFKAWCEKYAMFVLPFVTILREGLEAIIFIGGVSLGLPAASIPLAVVTGLAAGLLVGLIIYKGGVKAPLQIFLIISTCFLYLVAAGLFSRGIWYLETNQWNHVTGGDSSEAGSGAGSYDIRQSVWHVNCCSPTIDLSSGGWGIFNAILGWQNSATYGSVIGYNVFWIFVIISFVLIRWREQRGSWPLMKAKKEKAVPVGDLEKVDSLSSSDAESAGVVGKQAQVSGKEMSGETSAVAVRPVDADAITP